MKEAEVGKSVQLKRWIVVFNDKNVDCQPENLARIVSEHFETDQLSIIRPYQHCGLIIEMPETVPGLKDLPVEFLFIEPDQRNSILIR